ncbi:2,3-diaminopropionate biosynthesis protein SbnA [Paenibacillus lupini]|uniref:2,3-diaminopropionate biosynthesis protein SbnA n=1 Tax=Paenibacillus lupini TaxID=1450204 RepID=UPI001420072D|nr:2,3-diaminopropionate biosynthesis protein SbnA [Paenibacillus lupini]NIK23934.1 cysteine synthase A [Paenibacillus lupini]
MTVYNNIASMIGNTPMVKLGRLFEHAHFDIYAKLEMHNPGGSVKDRPAKAMLLAALEEGRIRPGSVIVESSSGNLAVGLAQLCNTMGFTFICVVDPKTTEANLRVLRAYGARIDLVKKPDPETGEFVPARLARVRRWLKRLPDAFWPNQYGNKNNSLSHQQTTMAEMAADLPHLDYLFCGVSTCGTIRGCVDYIRLNGLKTKVIAVDAEGSIIFGGEKGKVTRMLPGLGAGIKPGLCPDEGIHEIVKVNDRDCITGCRKLVRMESILAGGSSGGVIRAVEKYSPYIEPGSTCAVLLPDRGERYLNTVYDDTWVSKWFGNDFTAGLHKQGGAIEE